ncbi:M23 family metallopeptidase [soil metagenome]
MRSSRILIALVLASTLVAGATSASLADPKSDLLKEKKSLSGDIGDAKEDLEHSSKEYVAAKKALDAAKSKLATAENYLGQTRGKLAVAKARDAQMQAKLAESEAELTAARTALDVGSKQLDASEEAVKQFTLETLQGGDQGLRAFGDLLRGENPTVFGERISLTRSVSDAQVATMDRLEASRIILKVNRDAVRKLRDQVEAKRKEAAANLVTTRQLETSAENQAVAVAGLVDARKSAKGAANKALQEDAAKVRQLENDRARLNAELKALAEKEARDAAKGIKAPGSDGGGALSRPNGGIITSPYGMRVHPVTGVYKLHDGTDFRAACGSPVRAAAGGKVISEYYNGGYGNRLILANGMMRGKSVVTTYNHLTRYAVRSGATVKRGQIIAYAGTTGYSTGCHLHFMVIVNGQTVNPMGWL